MRALILDGARDDERTLRDLRAAVTGELFAAGYGIDEWILRETPIQPCEGDFGCLVKTPGVCGHADAGREIVEQFVRSDLTVWLSPVTFGGYSAQLTKAVDRLGCPLIWPSLSKLHGQHHYRPRYDAYPKLLVLGVSDERDAESERLLRALVARNAMTLYLPSHAVGVIAPGKPEAELRSTARRLLRTVRAD
ncbi:MAG: NAD(P)H-dependent oxidoreductase [Candidatus Methylomirabilota bacterium]